MLAILAPGQGSQSPGMLTPWLELPGADELIGEFGEQAGLDLRRLGTSADAEQITDTAVAQPLLVALGLLATAQLDCSTLDPTAVVAAGHSVGEITAVAFAHVLDPGAAVALAARRGSEMAAACALAPTGMSAVLSGDPDVVVDAITAAGLTPANRNGRGQIVAAGGLTELAALAADPPPGARLRPLAVAGAFHTEYMAPAEAGVDRFAAGVITKDPLYPLLSNADGTVVVSGAEVLSRLVAQITRPVRWDLCQQTLLDLGVDTIIELPPAGTLAGLAKREMGGGVHLVPMKTPDDIEVVQQLLDSHSLSLPEG